MSDKNLHKLSNKELFVEFYDAVIDIEKRLVKTVYHLIISPEKVINSYVTGKKREYASVFKFFLLTILISYINYEYFYEPGEINGRFYKSLKDVMEYNMNVVANLKGERVWVADESFHPFYLEFNRIVKMFYKLYQCITILVFLPLIYLFTRKYMNLATQIVMTVFLAGIHSLLHTLLVPLQYFVGADIVVMSNINLGLLGFYTWFFFYRVFRINKGRVWKTFLGALISIVLLFGMYVVMNGVITTYVQSYQKLEIQTEKL